MSNNLGKLVIAGLVCAVISFSANAAPGGGKGKPDDGGGGDVTCNVTTAFPFVAFPGDGGLILASEDGCRQLLVEIPNLGGYRLTVDGSRGYYAWSSMNYDSDTTYSVYAQEFTVNAAGELKLGTLNDAGEVEEAFPLQTILDNEPGSVHSFDIRGDVGAAKLAMVIGDATAEYRVAFYDSSKSDPVISTVYTAAPLCLDNPDEVFGCYRTAGGHIEMASTGESIYFSVTNDTLADGQIDSIVRSNKDESAPQWGLPQIILRGTFYREPGVESLKGDDLLLAVRYLAGFQLGGLRDDKIIFLTPSCDDSCDPSAPLLTDDVIQDVPSWHASWTGNNTVLLLGNEGKRRKLVHPIEEFDPILGLRTPLGIKLGSHPRIDSAL
jgi:hypothetical protein